MSKEIKKEYVCPQCGKDENGGDIHQLMYHTWPPLSIEESRKLLDFSYINILELSEDNVMNSHEAEELARKVLGIEENEEIDDIDEILLEKMNVDLQQFLNVSAALLPFTLPAEAGILDKKMYQGFVDIKENCFIVKREMIFNK